MGLGSPGCPKRPAFALWPLGGIPGSLLSLPYPFGGGGEWSINFLCFVDFEEKII